ALRLRASRDRGGELHERDFAAGRDLRTRWRDVGGRLLGADLPVAAGRVDHCLESGLIRSWRYLAHMLLADLVASARAVAATSSRNTKISLIAAALRTATP